ncbi:hypothetical protein CMCT_1636 [Campylobacter mucosalis]|uniref:hypothetical protein n=1 Tax=Campylobacter mucosalis TaxID=202 RepID=UPI00146FDE4E|nr:hypothetical protein [Campylobacter mucosalis]QKF63740.1 hypothetical protein CMCT_1636 [Campylobacter mucosalis]
MRKILVIFFTFGFLSALEFDFLRAEQFDSVSGFRSYSFVVTDKNKNTSNVSKFLGLNENFIVVLKLRVVNSKKEYYLQVYDKNGIKQQELYESSSGVAKILESASRL